MKLERLQPGNWVRKNNHTVFCKHKHEEGKTREDNDNALPFLLVETAKYRFNNYVLINGLYQQNPYSLVTMTEEEAIEYKRKWDECNISETIDTADITSCIREDNGQPKVKQPEWPRLKRILFEKQMTSPHKNFEAYKCSFCGALHIGKRKIKELNSTI